MVDLTDYKRFAKYFAIFILTYVFFVDWVIPSNYYIPSTYFVLESAYTMFVDYKFLNAIGLTFATTLFVPLGGFACFLITRYGVIKFALRNNWSSILTLTFRVIPYIMIPFLFTQIVGSSIIFQFLFLMIVGGIEQKIFLFDIISKLDRNFISAAKSLGLSDKEIYRDMLGQMLLPYVFGKIHYLFLSAWGYSMVFEIISGNYGLGTLLIKSLEFHDMAMLFLIFLVIVILIYLSGLAFKLVEKKVIYWIPDEIK